MSTTVPEIGYYALSRHPVTPGDLVAEARVADRIGLGAAFVSERFNIKDAAVLSGALGAATERMGIGVAATNHHTRHPIVTATAGATLAELTGGRFALGLGRGIGAQWRILGLPTVTGAQIADATAVLRRLWAGEMITGHAGASGSFPLLNLGVTVDVPIMLVTMSPATLRLAGEIADGVVLHTFLSDDATRAAVDTVRTAADRAGRDPASVRIWSVVATVADTLEPPEGRRRLYGRLATYLQGYGDVLARANGWSAAELDAVRASEPFTAARGPIDATATDGEIESLADVIPSRWVECCATGAAADCARTVADQFALGVDSVILHGATPAELEPVVEEYRRIRPARRELPVNPGRMI